MSSRERNWAMMAHLSSLAGLIGIPLGHLIGPLIVFLAKPSDAQFVDEHARESLNFQLTLTVLGIPALLAVALAWFAMVPFLMHATGNGLRPHAATPWVIGAAILTALWFIGALVAALVAVVVGAIAGADGRSFRYPLCIRFLRATAAVLPPG